MSFLSIEGLLSDSNVNEYLDRRDSELLEEFFLAKGRDYTEGYLSSFDGHPIRRFLAEKQNTKEGRRYRAAKSALENL